MTKFKICAFLLHSFCGKWGGLDPVNRFTNTSWHTLVTPTDLPKSVRMRFVIEGFGSVIEHFGGDFVFLSVKLSYGAGILS